MSRALWGESAATAPARRNAPGATLPTQRADGELRAPEVEIEPGAQIGGYVVEACRGAGGFASVYRARDAATGMPVAIKVLHAFLARTPSVRRRFHREAETIARLAHPRIVRLRDHGEHRGLPYLVMDWVDGATLAEEIRTRGPIPLDDAMPIFEDLAAALAAAHVQGVVHRDLKVGNVALAGRGAVLLDFGIAKLADAPAGFTTPGSRLGTPHYMAPEQILGRPVDARTDVYAFGILAFEVLTGRRPFDGPSAAAIEERQLAEPPPSASELAPVPAAIGAVIRRAMAKQPERRHAGIAELWAELRAAAAGAPPPALCRRAIALYLHARLPADGADPTDPADPADPAYDDALDRLDRVVANARSAAARLGLEVAAEIGGSLLLLGLPGDGEAAGHVAELASFARGVAADATRAGAPVALTVHVGDVELGDGRPGARFVGGAVLDVAAWARTDAPGVHLTPAARRDRA